MRRHLPTYAGLGLLLVVSFLVLDSIFGYVFLLQYETNDCFFLFGREFLMDFLAHDHPAGLLCYAGRFLGQFYHDAWLGALAASACITCFGVLFHGVLAKLKGDVRVAETLFPCIFLAALHASPVCLIHDTLGLCASCGAFLGCLAFRRKLLRRAYALAATPLAYWLIGAYFWFFAAWVAALQWTDRRERRDGFFLAAYFVFSAAAPLAAWRWVFPIPLLSALLWPMMAVPPLRSGVMHCTVSRFAADCFLALVLCAWLLVVPFERRLLSRRPSAAPGRSAPAWRSRLVPAVASPLIALLLCLVQHDAKLNTFVTCNRLYKQEQWDALLEKAKENRSADLRVQFMTNFALYKKGRLLDEMFQYPQDWGARGLVFNISGGRTESPAEDDADRGMYNSDLFYQMGYINGAFIHAYNYMDDLGESYDAVKRMAQCAMAGGAYAVADKYLNMLARTLFYRDFARRSKAAMADPHAMEREYGAVRKRRPVVEGDIFSHPLTPFRMLIQSPSGNPMALEYLTAWCLLDKRSIAEIASHIEDFKKAGYASLPIYCQEALLLLERQKKGGGLQGFRYDPAVAARVQGFFRDLLRYANQPEGPEQLRALYGDTYMFYCFCVTTPADIRPQIPEAGGAGAGYERE